MYGGFALLASSSLVESHCSIESENKAPPLFQTRWERMEGDESS